MSNAHSALLGQASTHQIASAPFSHAWHAKDHVHPEVAAKYPLFRSKLGRPAAIYFPGTECLTVGSSAKEELKRLDYKLKADGLPVRQVVGPDEIAVQIAQRILQREGREIIYQRRRELQFLAGTPIYQPLMQGRIRAAVESDLDVMIQMYLHCFPGEECYPEDPAFRVDAWMTQAVHVGGAFVWDFDGPRAAAIFGGFDQSTVEITTVMTLPEFRGKGCAPNLIAHMVGQLALRRGPQIPVLQVDQTNQVAGRVYAKMGFEPLNWWQTIRFER